MNEDFEQALERLRQWAEAARRAGWLERRALQRLERIERQQAEALFARQGERPLIVAFFGGTGVGKSSLLNRLAGMEIARVGVERPTSHEVTLYLHQDYRLADLPPDLPMEETRVAYHHDDRRRLIAWLDLPDIDSVEMRHRKLVEAWLPYVDWLVYVVSPERYQDDLGWRFVQRRGASHAWLFVINQWDRGAPEQLEDFRRRLQQEGFEEPLILTTSCIDGVPGDQFERLEQTIETAVREYGLEVLQRLGVQARLQELEQNVERFRHQLEGYDLPGLAAEWNELQQQRLQELALELNAAARLLVQTLEQGQRPWWRPGAAGEAEGASGGAVPGDILQRLWCDRFDSRLQDLALALDALRQRRGVPPQPFDEALKQFPEQAREAFLQAAGTALAGAMARPGGVLRRLLLRLSDTLVWLLPLSAALWVGWYLVSGFYAGTQGRQPFLGVDFAVHSLLLIGVAWFVPWLAGRRLRPRPAEVVARGLKQGIRDGLAAVAALGGAVPERLQHALQRQLEDLAGLFPRPLAGQQDRLPAGRGPVAAAWRNTAPEEAGD